MTTAGFVSGTRDETSTRCSLGAAVSSALLGVTLIVTLPALFDAAFYVGILAAAVASLALLAGYALWTGAVLVMRTMATISAGSTVLAGVFQVVHGIPGAARQIGGLTPVESGAALGLGGCVLALLLLDALLHRPEQAPDHPYAL